MLGKLLKQAERVDAEQRGRLFSYQAPETIVLDTAENVLIFDLLSPLLNDSRKFNLRDTQYPDTNDGDEDIRQGVADLLTQSFGLTGEKALTANNVIATNGVTGALYLHAIARLRPGLPVLFPTPCWQGFLKIYGKAQTRPVDVPGDVSDGFALRLETLQRAYGECVKRGERPQALVLTNPHNPLGTNYDRRLLEALYTWVLTETEMDIVSDEIYAHSQSGPSDPFVSALALDISMSFQERVHVAWGFAKDFGLSGFKAGMLLTRSARLRADISQNYVRFSPFDNLKNFTFRKLLPALRPSMSTYRNRITPAHRAVSLELQSSGIPYVGEALAGQFFWLDLRAWLGAGLPRKESAELGLLEVPTADENDPREEALSKYLASEARVVLLRGQTMHCPVPGFFRLCFTAEDTAVVCEAVRRIGNALQRLSSMA